MYELEVLETILYSKFQNIAEIKRKCLDEKGKLFVGDKIKVKTKEEVEYLCGNNPKKIIACKVISEPIIEEVETEEITLSRKKRTTKKEKNYKKLNVYKSHID